MLDKFEVFLDALEKHFQFLGSVGLETKKLQDRFQKPCESVSEYLAALQYQASFCAYGPKLEGRAAELFLEGFDSKRAQDCILHNCVGSTVPTLDWIFGLARQFEQLSITTEQFH